MPNAAAVGMDTMWHYEFYRHFGPVGPLGGLVGLLLYLAPALIAFARGHLSAWAILVLDVVFGWTGIGWIVALIWALTGNTARNRGLR